jgi:hypothetical protein
MLFQQALQKRVKPSPAFLKELAVALAVQRCGFGG